MIELNRWSCRSIPPELHWQAVSFMRTAWPLINGGSLRQAYPREVMPTYYTVTEDDDLLLNFAATFTTAAISAGTSLTTTCLGNVFTFPSARRRGLARMAIEAATADVFGSGADVAALLCDPSLQPFYAASGWHAVPNSPTIAASGEELDSLRMMIFVSPQSQSIEHALRTHPLEVPAPW